MSRTYPQTAGMCGTPETGADQQVCGVAGISGIAFLLPLHDTHLTHLNATRTPHAHATRIWQPVLVSEKHNHLPADTRNPANEQARTPDLDQEIPAEIPATPSHIPATA